MYLAKKDEKIPSFDEALGGYLDFRYGFLPPPDFLIRGEINTFSIGTTSYADLNTRSTGSDTYTGNSTTLYVDTAGSNAASAVDTAGDVAGSLPLLIQLILATELLLKELLQKFKLAKLVQGHLLLIKI